MIMRLYRPPCGKALPFRKVILFPEAAPRFCIGGVASGNVRTERKDKAFPRGGRQSRFHDHTRFSDGLQLIRNYGTVSEFPKRVEEIVEANTLPQYKNRVFNQVMDSGEQVRIRGCDDEAEQQQTCRSPDE
jgi:hypothetical protein